MVFALAESYKRTWGGASGKVGQNRIKSPMKTGNWAADLLCELDANEFFNTRQFVVKGKRCIMSTTFITSGTTDAATFTTTTTPSNTAATASMATATSSSIAKLLATDATRAPFDRICVAVRTASS
jgi:hypothetical protein